MPGKYLPERTKIVMFMLTDNAPDAQGEVGCPSEAVLQEREFTHFLSYFLDVTKLDLSAQ